jgi:hypothetical protein
VKERTCHDCGDPISGRRRRCDDCKKRAHAKAERERYHRGEDPADSPLDEGPVVDLTQPGAASKPPDFSGVRKTQPQQMWTEPQGVRGEVSRASVYERRHPLDGVKGADRHDLVKAQRLASDLAAAEDRAETSWAELSATPEEQNWMVNFGRPASFREQPTLTPSPYAAAILGQAVTSTRPRPTRADGQQRAPHIVN